MTLGSPGGAEGFARDRWLVDKSEAGLVMVGRDVVRTGPKQSLEPIRFGEFLREKCAITDEQLLDALADHWAHGGRLGATIARRGFLSIDEVERLADEYHLLQVVEVEVPVRPRTRTPVPGVRRGPGEMS